MTPNQLRRLIALGLTVLAAWAVLVVPSAENLELQVGMPSPEDFMADTALEVFDEEATRNAQEAAAALVADVYVRDPQKEEESRAALRNLFNQVREGVPAEPDPTATTLPELTPGTTTTAAGDTTTTTAPETVELVGRVFIDADGDGIFELEVEQGLADRGLAGIEMVVIDGSGTTVRGATQSDGSYRIAGVAVGEVAVSVDLVDPDFPGNWPNYPADLKTTTPESLAQLLECFPGEECAAADMGFTPLSRRLEDQVAELVATYRQLEPALTVLAQLATDDLVRAAAGEETWLAEVEETALGRLHEEFDRELKTIDDLFAARKRLEDNPPFIFFGRDRVEFEPAERAVAEVLSLFLVQNMAFDATETERQKQAARDAVPNQLRTYQAGQTIVQRGEPLEPADIQAIQRVQPLSEVDARRLSLLAVMAVVVAVIASYVARFRPAVWNRLRSLALLCLLLTLAAGAVRLTVMVHEASSWYVLPAVAFGFIAAVLFDARIAVVVGVAMAIFAAAGSGDAGLAVYGLLATMAPIGFVSSISTRRDTRLAVLASSLVVALIAAATSWFFHTGLAEPALLSVGLDVAWAFGTSLVAALVVLAAISFLEAAFDITTNLRLLEVTDRNHAALQLLQELAFGTFNHSLMVGTLADAAAQAIGANNLLARAAAYYHDLGKTEDPVYFIENQFGMSNPHDELAPEQSVEVIRRHVEKGIALARRYRIPSAVAEGIVTHHGDSVMRYFYEKARQRYGDAAVDIDSYRHQGRRPRSKEMAIVMMADSLESAARGEFQIDDPTAEKIASLVDRVIGEKVNDGQLSECDLTLGELSRVRRAFLEALIGHYHQRIPYPNFPGLPAEGRIERLPEPGRD